VLIDYRCENNRLSGAREFHGNFKPLIGLSSSEIGVDPGVRSGRMHLNNEHDVRKPMVISISRRGEELRLYNLV
jgi:hypothetical protein